MEHKIDYKLNHIKEIPILSVRDTSKNYVYIEIRVNYGSLSETIPEMAHLIEHWLILGTERYPSRKDTYDIIEEVGGKMNAYTSDMHTGYWVKVPAEHLKRAVEVLTQIFFHPLIKEEEEDYAKHPINVELNGRMKDKFYQLSALRTRSIFEKTNPGYRLLIEERLESVKNITREQVYNTYNEVYVKPNISIGIGGNFEEKELDELLNEYVGDRDGKKINIDLKIEFKEEIMIQDLKNELISIAFKLSEETPEGEILNYIIGGRNSARLPTLIRNEKNLSYSTGSAFIDYWGENLLVTYSDCNIGDHRLVESLILKVCNEVINGDLTEEEFIIAKQSKIGNIKLKDNINGMVQNLLGYYRIKNKVYTLDDEIEEINKVTFAQFKEYLTKLDFSKFAVARILEK